MPTAPDFIPAPGFLLAEYIESNQSTGGILIPQSAARDNHKKVIVLVDPSGTYVPGTEIFPQEGTALPAQANGRVFWWIDLTKIYGYRALVQPS